MFINQDKVVDNEHSIQCFVKKSSHAMAESDKIIHTNWLQQGCGIATAK